MFKTYCDYSQQLRALNTFYLEEFLATVDKLKTEFPNFI